MDSIFKIDFDNSDQFPVLNGILNYLDKFTPYKNLEIFEAKEYNAKIYNGEINKNAETSEQAKKDVNRIIGKIKSSMIKMSVSIETANYFEKLFKERDKLAINIPDNQRDYNIKTYNRHIIQKVEKYEYHYSFLLSIFDEYFDASQWEKLNMKSGDGIPPRCTWPRIVTRDSNPVSVSRSCVSFWVEVSRSASSAASSALAFLPFSFSLARRI